MTHTPHESKAWHRAGAADRPSSSSEQHGRRDQPASDLPAAQHDADSEGQMPPFPEAKRHEGDRPGAGEQDQAQDRPKSGEEDSSLEAGGHA